MSTIAASHPTQPVARRKSIKPALTGDMPNPISPPTGCHFHPRCPHAMDVCRATYPATRIVAGNRAVACHLYPEVEPAATGT